jgi:hypothetical protein
MPRQYPDRINSRVGDPANPCPANRVAIKPGRGEMWRLVLVELARVGFGVRTDMASAKPVAGESRIPSGIATPINDISLIGGRDLSRPRRR